MSGGTLMLGRHRFQADVTGTWKILDDFIVDDLIDDMCQQFVRLSSERLALEERVQKLSEMMGQAEAKTEASGKTYSEEEFQFAMERERTALQAERGSAQGDAGWTPDRVIELVRAICCR